ncbi:MAG: hypothetical protein JO057_28185 [Chloroflexi bacterium]|nr:hypothetical protein [Chloroflexota bacterium]
MFVVTFHGGGSGGTQTLVSYPDQGGTTGTAYLAQLTPKAPNGFRDVQFLPRQAGGNFYLVNSYKTASDIYQISPSAATATRFVTGSGGGNGAVCSVYHPFGLAFDGGLDVLYISNQDSNVVVRVYGPNSATTPGQPMPLNPALVAEFENGVFLPGTFVASHNPLMPSDCSATPTPVHSHQGGLQMLPPHAPSNGTPTNSVRGVALLGSTLYVADEVASLIRQYDTTSGTYLGAVGGAGTSINSPLHLVAYGDLLYIGVEAATSNSDALVVSYNPSTRALSTVVTQSKSDLPIKHPSGMTFDGQGNFYLADLDNAVVYRFDSNFKLQPGAFISNMLDQPEFILWVDDQWLPT